MSTPPISGHHKTSTLLMSLSETLSASHVKIGYLCFKLRRRSFGGLLFFLSVISFIPGISIFSSIAIIVLAMQLCLGYKYPFLPRSISSIRLKVDLLKAVLVSSAAKLKLIEGYTKPRLTFLTSPTACRVMGILIVFLALLIMLPLPFTNFLPAMAIFAFAVALAERDGYMVILGVILSAMSFWLVYFLVQLATA